MHEIWIAILLCLLGIVTMNTLVNATSYVYFIPEFEPLSNAFGYAIAPVLFLVVKTLKGDIPNRFVILHLLIPSLVLLATILEQFLWPSSILSALVEGSFFTVLWNIHFALYLCLSFVSLPKIAFRNEEKLVLTLFWGIAAIWSINLVNLVVGELFFPNPIFWNFNTTILFFCLTLYIFYNKLFFPNTKRKSSRRGLSVNLDEKKLSKDFEVVLKEIKLKKLYRKPDLNVRNLSTELGISYAGLSHMINSETGINFNDFINRLRVDEVVTYLKSDAHKDYTIIGLAQQAGFRSASSFYTAFRKVTNTTPTKFITQFHDI